LRPNTSNATVSYGDKTRSIIMGLAEVVLTRDVSLINVKLVETLLFVHQLGFTGLATFFGVDFVILLWSKTPKRCFFVRYTENGPYVVDFSGNTTTTTISLLAKTWWDCRHVHFMVTRLIFSELFRCVVVLW
jgi:hypothetical protein